MNIAVRGSWVGLLSALVVAAGLTSAAWVGCAPPEKAAGPAKEQPPKNISEPAASPAIPAKTEEPAALPEVPAKPQQPAAMAEPAAAKPETPAVKPEETVALPPAPEPPAAKVAEPAVKPETPVKPEATPVKPSEPAAGGGGGAADVKVSAFAPADDLANQLDEYVKDLEKTVETEQEFKDSEGKVGKEANTLIVIALALGLHDQPNPYKANAASIIKAGQELAKGANDYESAKKGVAAVKGAIEGKGPGGSELKWEKVAATAELMKQVPLVNTKLKRYVQGSRFKSKAKDSQGFSAVIAAIGQASIADTSETKSPDEVKQWQGFCVELRDAAGSVNAVIRAGEPSACDAAMAKLAQSCDDCHAVFHKGEKSETEKSEK